jgi:hypothetical protein
MDHHQVDGGYFLIREQGKPDRRVERSAEMPLFDAVKVIAAAHGADSTHIFMTNKPSEKPRIEVVAYLPLDEARAVKFSLVS